MEGMRHANIIHISRALRPTSARAAGRVFPQSMQQLICALPCYKVCCSLPVVPIAYTPHSNLLSSHAPDDWVSFRVLQRLHAQTSRRCGIRSAASVCKELTTPEARVSHTCNCDSQENGAHLLVSGQTLLVKSVSMFIDSLHGCSGPLRLCCSRGRVYAPQRCALCVDATSAYGTLGLQSHFSSNTLL